MTVAELVYTFKLKADKLDSKSLANIKLAPTIYLLNEGMQALINKRYGGLNTNYQAAFEEIQKRRDEFQILIVPDEYLKVTKVDNEIYTADLGSTKEPYMFLLRTNAYATKKECAERRMKGILVQTDDLDIIVDSPMDSSSFEWGEVVFRLAQNKIRFITDTTFVIKKARIDYLRYPKSINMVGYKQFDGSPSTDQECELPKFMHADIVEEALLIYDSSFNNPDMRARLAALQNKE
jgi:hypothetical protein